MAIGRPLTKDGVNQQAANLAGALFSTLDNIAKFKAVLDGMTSADLVTLGFVQTDADQLKSAVGDMGEVVAYFQGGAPAGQKDRRTFARRLLGDGVY